jgi:hypothetical protein
MENNRIHETRWKRTRVFFGKFSAASARSGYQMERTTFAHKAGTEE